MQMCILGFEGSHAADDAYGEILETDGEHNRWLLEVGTIARPLVGRVRVGVTFPDGESQTFLEGDLASAAADVGGLTGYFVSALTGPFGAMFAAAESVSSAYSSWSDAEQRLFHLDDIKQALPRDGSALVLIANEDTCRALVELFKDFRPKVILRNVEADLHARLEAIERRAKAVQQGREGGAPAGL